jgi:hypothetical protein
MSQSPLMPQSDFQRLVIEQALAYAQHLEQTSRSAPPGQLLDLCESVVLERGRQLLRDSLAAALQQQISEGEKKGLPPVSVLVASLAVTKALTLAVSSLPSDPSA